MKKLNQRGFSSIEVLLLLILLSIIGGVGYYVYNTQKHTKTPETSTSKTTLSKSEAKPVDPYAGWQTYTSNYNKASFRYPSDWTLKVEENQVGQDPDAKVVTLTSPHGLIVNYNDYLLAENECGIDGSNAPNLILTSLENISPHTKPNLYLVGFHDMFGLTDNDLSSVKSDLDTGGCGMILSIKSKVHPDVFMSLGNTFGLTQNGQTNPLPAAQQPDIATAKSVLKSFKY